MPEERIEVEEFNRIVDCGEEVDFNADLDHGVIRVRRGLTPTEYVRIGLKMAAAVALQRSSMPFVGSVD